MRLGNSGWNSFLEGGNDFVTIFSGGDDFWGSEYRSLSETTPRCSAEEISQLLKEVPYDSNVEVESPPPTSASETKIESSVTASINMDSSVPNTRPGTAEKVVGELDKAADGSKRTFIASQREGFFVD